MGGGVDEMPGMSAIGFCWAVREKNVLIRFGGGMGQSGLVGISETSGAGQCHERLVA